MFSKKLNFKFCNFVSIIFKKKINKQISTPLSFKITLVVPNKYLTHNRNILQKVIPTKTALKRKKVFMH